MLDELTIVEHFSGGFFHNSKGLEDFVNHAGEPSGAQGGRLRCGFGDG